MSDMEYQDADYQVIKMVNKGRGPGGQLPCKTLHFIPEERAESVLALDERIQKIRKAMPLIIFGATVLFAFIAGMAL